LKLRWVLLPVIAGAVYFAFFGGEYTLRDVRRLQKQRDAEQQQLQQAKLDVARLRAHADSLEKDSVTLERVAREKYGMVKPGERLYRFADKKDTTHVARDTTRKK
jgi:cell division protein FtsB